MSIGVESGRLPGGLELIVVTHPTVQTFTATLWAKRGAKDDPVHKASLAHLCEHLYLTGTVGQGSPAQTIEEVGGAIGGATYRDSMRVEIRAGIGERQLALDLLGQVWRRGPDTSSIPQERMAVLGEINEYRDLPEQWISSLLWDRIGRDDFFRGFRRELFDGITAIRDEDVQEWAKSLGSDHWVLEVFSPFTLSELYSSVTDAFQVKEIPGSIPRREAYSPLSRRVVRLHKASSDSQAYVGILFAHEAQSLIDMARIRVLWSLLVGGTQGRLGKELRERRGLIYDITADHASTADIDALEFFTSVNIGREEELVTVLDDQLQAVAEGLVTEAEFRRAKAYAKGYFAMEVERPLNCARWMGNQFVNRGSLLRPSVWSDFLDSVEIDDVSRISRRLFREGDAIWAISTRDLGNLEQAANRLGTVERVTW